MSTCPEKDIHSVYLDGELPENFVARYEAHVASCPSCQAQLNVLRELRDVFKEDSSSIDLTQKQLDDSFMRLQARMSYSKFTARNRNEFSFDRKKTFGAFKYFAAGIAAAFALMFVLPAKYSHRQNEVPVAVRPPVPYFAPVARSELSAPSSQVRYNGQVNPVQLESIMGTNEGNLQYLVPVANSDMPHFAPGFTPDSFSSSRPNLTNYDVFPPPECFRRQDEKSRNFSFKVSSPVGNISLEFGN